MSRSQRYNDNDDDDNSDYSYEVTSNEDEDDDDDDFQIRKNKNFSPSAVKSTFVLNVPQHSHLQYQQHQQLQRQQAQQNRLVQKQKSKQKMKAKHYHVHPQRKPRRLFTPEEDQLLLSLVEKYGQNSWTDIAEKIPGRSSRQCKERYLTYLCPTVNHSPWTEDEDVLLLQKVHEMGKRWSDMSKFFNGRTANAIKNRYHLHLRGHFNDSRNKHPIQTQHHKDLSIPLCARANQQPIPHGSAVVMNTIPNGFPAIPSSSTASSSPLAGAPPSSTVIYAYPSTSFTNNSNPYSPNVNGIIIIPSNYDMPIKDRRCDILPNGNVIYNGYNGYTVEPQYVNPPPLTVQSNIVINNSSNSNLSNATDYNYYNTNYYLNPNPSSKMNSFNQNPQYAINNANHSFNSNICTGINSVSYRNIINNRNTTSPLTNNYSSSGYVKIENVNDMSSTSRNHLMIEPISQYQPPGEDNQHLVYSKKHSEVNNNKSYDISNFLVNNDNNQANKMEEKPKEGHSKTRILLPSLPLLFPVKP